MTCCEFISCRQCLSEHSPWYMVLKSFRLRFSVPAAIQFSVCPTLATIVAVPQLRQPRATSFVNSEVQRSRHAACGSLAGGCSAVWHCLQRCHSPTASQHLSWRGDSPTEFYNQGKWNLPRAANRQACSIALHFGSLPLHSLPVAAVTLKVKRLRQCG